MTTILEAAAQAGFDLYNFGQQCRKTVERVNSKFHGEQPYVPYFWEGVNPVSTEGGVFTYHVTRTDQGMFPEELRGKKTIRLMETCDGDVMEVEKEKASC